MKAHDEPRGPAAAMASVRYGLALLALGEAQAAQLLLGGAAATLGAALQVVQEQGRPQSEEEAEVGWPAGLCLF